MNTLFDVLKMTTIDHQNLTINRILITDTEGKPNAILTELFHDVINKIRLFIDFSSVDSADSLIMELSVHTPLPDEVLSEYQKILTEPLLGINFAARKGEIELIVK
ncbi:hypothetical protein C5L31_001695 [Secundilactobacillus malefermentans]|uniref:Uncharacterized protein n=1 Tax=Secundilactobacillus malefermentans TaxID=176292 RepID=A0A4R5NKB8_9LACO|nr:hypothetical protein [Secundilactobacillus malefermentans]KRM58734.1 hypothetical protein FD44_GL000355 [Secundilactobacillus malefermentans DSM 5705 = KCTC 3548]TDG75065.1 hypothetical protein C5L31_001695 [Secundilactobacillus malefermentans]